MIHCSTGMRKDRHVAMQCKTPASEAPIHERNRLMFQALTFDIRRATHSIGSNVRDAAAYVLWSLSRACPADVIRPFAEDMATSLISVACLDREVGVRRAASAAYQEGVGRLVCAYHLSRTIHPMEVREAAIGAY